MIANTILIEFDYHKLFIKSNTFNMITYNFFSQASAPNNYLIYNLNFDAFSKRV